MQSPDPPRARRWPSLSALALLAGCHAPPPAPPPRAIEAGCVWDARWSETAGAAHQFQVSAGAGAEALCIEAELPRGTGWIAVGTGARAFARDVAVMREGAWEEAPSRGIGYWLGAACEGAACRVRYRFLLGEAARGLADRDTAFAHGDTLLAPASTFLARPIGEATAGAFRMRVATPEGLRFVTGLRPLREARGVYEGEAEDLASLPYGGFGRFDIARVSIGDPAERAMGDAPGQSVEVAFAPGALPHDVVRPWIAASASALASYFGFFPAEHALLLVLPDPSGARVSGATMGGSGASVMLTIGPNVTSASLRDDWVLVHELVHVAFPNVGRRWAEEGMATYLEPVIRARAGLLDPHRMWRDLIAGLPQGQPGPGDRGLDATDTWGRRYWGGAGFWFVADVEIRERSGGARSLDDALRGIVLAGGNVAATWDLERALGLGDTATGVPVLVDLYRRVGSAPVALDLDAHLAKLGVSIGGDGRVAYDDTAPNAAMRRAITAKP